MDDLHSPTNNLVRTKQHQTETGPAIHEVLKDANSMSEQQSEFSDNYSDANFWDKVRQFAQAAGVEVIDRAFQLYCAAHGPNTPMWAKATIYGALGYFISPIDAIPDLVPVVGYSDDLGVLALAVATCATYITPEVKAQAKQAKQDLWENVFGGS